MITFSKIHTRILQLLATFFYPKKFKKFLKKWPKKSFFTKVTWYQGLIFRVVKDLYISVLLNESRLNSSNIENNPNYDSVSCWAQHEEQHHFYKCTTSFTNKKIRILISITIIYLLEVKVFQIEHISVELYEYKNISYWRCNNLIQIHSKPKILVNFRRTYR